MSKVLIGFNIKDIPISKRKKIIEMLYKDLISDLNQLKIYYRRFGNIQILHSDYNKDKIKILSKDNILINICGLIDNEKQIQSRYRFKRLEQALIGFYKESIEKLISIVKEFTGHFVIFIYNKTKDELIIINDKLGSYPAYIYKNKDWLIYSTGAEAILCLDNIPKKINYNAIADLLSLGVAQNRASFISNINNLKPATILRKDKWSSNKKIYYNFDLNEDWFLQGDSLEKVNKKIQSIVLNLFDNHAKDTHLTGGFDTRLINSILLENNRKPVAWFLKNNLITNPYDKKIGHRFAKAYKIKYKEIEPANDSPFKKRGPEHLISGVFGGVFFGGSIYYKEMEISYNYSKNIFSKQFINLLDREPMEEYNNNIKEIKSKDKAKRTYVYKFNLYISTFYNFIDGQYMRRPNNLFYKNLHYPFLNSELIEILFKIPFANLQNHRFYKKLLETYYKNYCNIIFLHGRNLYKYRTEKKPHLYLLKPIPGINKNLKIDLSNRLEESPISTQNIDNDFLGIPVLNKKGKLDKISLTKLDIIKSWFANYYL